jgi:hypothetical protein
VLRLLTRMWGIDPSHASAVAPSLGADVPACLLSMSGSSKAGSSDWSRPCLAFGPAGRQLCSHVGKRRDLLCAVRQRTG